MREEEFKKWLGVKFANQATIATRRADAKRVETSKTPVNLDQEYEKDGLTNVINKLNYSLDDHNAAKPLPFGIAIDTQKGGQGIVEGLASIQQGVKLYQEFCIYSEKGDNSDEAILHHFRDSPQVKNLTDKQKSIFCQVARMVHEAGLDWYLTNVPDIRFGRKTPGLNIGNPLGTLRSGFMVTWGSHDDRGAGAREIDEKFGKTKSLEDFLQEFPQFLRTSSLSGLFRKQGRQGHWPDEYSQSEKAPPAPSSTGHTKETKHPLNQILFGPPGTGKTFKTAQIAVEICDGFSPEEREATMIRYRELEKAKRIDFTTFHQSIGYEEFVEGMRPMSNETGAGFTLEAKDGIFKNICNLAKTSTTESKQAEKYDFTNRQFYKMSLGAVSDGPYIYDAAIGGNYLVLGWGGDVDWTDEKYRTWSNVAKKWREKEPEATGNSGNIAQVWCFRNMNIGDIVIVSNGNLQFRAIGEITGDYYYEEGGIGGNHKRKVKWLLILETPLPATLIQTGNFSQISCYSLQWQSIKMDAILNLIGGDETSPNEANNFVLIVDEINRANISKVLGELITLIEHDKRIGAENALSVTLPYSNQTFGVPPNLYIIGTMNTADRSIALLDTALRRRFEFTEMMPNYEVLNGKMVGEISLSELLKAINEKIEYLFDRDHQIGHAYFCDCDDKTKLDSVMRNKIIPLLAEYFYDDWEKIIAILPGFIDKIPLSSPFKNGAVRYSYKVKERFDDNAYLLTSSQTPQDAKENPELAADEQ